MDNVRSWTKLFLFEQRSVDEFAIGFLTWASQTVICFEACGFGQAEEREYETGGRETA